MPWELFVINGLLLVGSILVGLRCDILSRRIDTVHKRITLNNLLNKLDNGGWGDPE